MVLSKYVIKINIDNKKYYYNLINGDFKLIDECEETDEFFVKDDRDEMGELLNYNEELRKKSNFMCITIAVTNACNFRCSYCFEDHKMMQLECKTISKVEHIIEEYAKQNNYLKRIVIIWFGGEPTLNMKYIIGVNSGIKKVVEKLGLEYSSRMITNGYLIDRVLPHIKELNLTDIQITFDGMRDVHDSRRRTKDGNGSFDVIVNNLTKIHEKIDLVIRANVDKNNIDSVYELYKYIKTIKIDDCVDLYFQPMLVENYGGESECYLGKITKDEEFYRKYIDLLVYTNSLEKPCFLRAFCNVDFPGSLVISSNGDLHKCWAEVNNMDCSFCNLNMEAKDIVKKMQNVKSQLKYERCKECKIFPVCMGGCKFINYTSSECSIRRKMKIEEIKRYIRYSLNRK